MKLFLSSVSVTGPQGQALAHLVGKPAREIKFALIENAAEPYPDYPSPWLLASRADILAQPFQTDILDLKTYQTPADLKAKLITYDVIWLSGGNTYYLRWLLRETGADRVITELVNEGKVYGGGSAGAIMAGPTLKFFEVADDPKMAPEVLLDGLHFTDSVIVPHFDMAKYRDIMQGIVTNLKQAGYKPVPLTNSQAMVINGFDETII
jgi:dipeptidase E